MAAPLISDKGSLSESEVRLQKTLMVFKQVFLIRKDFITILGILKPVKDPFFSDLSKYNYLLFLGSQNIL